MMYSHSISTSNACQEGIVTQTIILERSACFSVTGLPNEGQSHMTKGPAAALAIHFFLLYLSLSRCASRGYGGSKSTHRRRFFKGVSLVNENLAHEFRRIHNRNHAW